MICCSSSRPASLSSCLRGLFALIALALLTAPAFAGDLKTIKTRHYTLRTDVDPALAADLAKRMDAMYDEYDRRMADFQKPADTETLSFDVHVFDRRADYAAFTQNKVPNSGGVFMPGKNALAGFLEGQGRDGLRRTLQHEAFHQFAFTVIARELPIWLNEGIAQLFEEGIWTGKAFLLNQVPPRRVRQLQEDAKGRRLIPFKDFLTMTHDQWNENLAKDADKGGTQYNQAWAMVQFLVNATDAAGRPAYRQRLVDLLKLLNKGTPSDEAFKQAFPMGGDELQRRFAEWAMRLKPTREATFLERQEVLADLLTGLADKGQRFRDVDAFKNAVVGNGMQIHYSRGRIRWQTEADPAVYFADMQGRPYGPKELFFQNRPGAPLPDIICRAASQVQIRTRFHESGKNIEHEVVIEAR
ncbi:MAG TPA: DUF1570 domain-containing protein [Tepidisphaeraceae bacterium]|nr:DUF1570 domain-containing protein [Tepidisphaeraceae bacterium]